MSITTEHKANNGASLVETIGVIFGAIFSLTIAFAILFIAIGGLEWLPPSAEKLANRARKQWLNESFDIPRRIHESDAGKALEEAIDKADKAALNAEEAVWDAGVMEIAAAREAQVMADERLAVLEAQYNQLFNQFGRELAEKYPQVPEASDYYYDFDRKLELATE